MYARTDSTRIWPPLDRRQAYFAPELRIDQRPRNDVRVRYRILREEAESEAACDHGQYPIVSIAPVDGFAVDIARIEHTVDNVVELTERPLHVAFAGEIRYLDLISRDETVPGRKHDHHLLAKQRQIVQAGIRRAVGAAVDRNLRRRGDELFFNRLGRAVNQVQLDIGTRTAKAPE